MARLGSSYESMREDDATARPKPRKNWMAPAILLAVTAALVAVVIDPSLRKQITTFFPAPVSKQIEMEARVWADRQTGSYYCADSRLFGRGAGSYMKQGDALTLGFQPALGKYCQPAYPEHSRAFVHTPDPLTRSVASRSSSPTPMRDSR